MTLSTLLVEQKRADSATPGGGETWNATTMVNFATHPSLTWVDASSQATAHSITSGLASITLDLTVSTVRPSDGAYWIGEIQINGASVSTDRLEGLLRCVIEDFALWHGAKDIEVFMAVIDGSDPNTANGFGVSHIDIGTGVRQGTRVWQALGGTWTSANSTNALLDVELGAADLSWAYNAGALNRSRTYLRNTVTGAASTAAGSAAINNTAPIDFSGGAWIMFGAMVRATSSGTQEIETRPLAALTVNDNSAAGFIGDSL